MSIAILFSIEGTRSSSLYKISFAIDWFGKHDVRTDCNHLYWAIAINVAKPAKN